MSSKDSRFRENVTEGAQVQILLKEDMKNGHLTKGIVAEILTEAKKHPQGIRVKLRSGKVGHIKKILSSKKIKNPVQRDEE